MALAALTAVGLALAGCTAGGPDRAGSTTPAATSVLPSAAPPAESVGTPLGDPTMSILQYLADPQMEAAANGTFRTFLRLVAAANLTSIVNGPGPMTVFAPTDEAFQRRFTTAQLDALAASPVDLARLVNFHIVNGAWPVRKVSIGTLPTLEGNELHGALSGGVLSVNGAVARTVNLTVANGYVYGVNDVLLPPSFQLPAAG